MGLICWGKKLNIEEITCWFIGTDGGFNFYLLTLQLRQTHSRSSSQFHSYGSFSSDVSGSCIKSQWPVHANSLPSAEPSNIDSPTRLILGTKLIEIFAPLSCHLQASVAHHSGVSADASVPASAPAHKSLPSIECTSSLSSWSILYHCSPSRSEVRFKECDLCCTHTSLEIQRYSVLPDLLPARTQCFSLHCCPLPPWNHTPCGRATAGWFGTGKKVCAVPVRKAVVVPHIAWPRSYSTQRGRRGHVTASCQDLQVTAPAFSNGRPKRQRIRGPGVKRDFLGNKAKPPTCPVPHHASPPLQGERLRAGAALSYQHSSRLQKQELGPSCISVAILKTPQVLPKCCHMGVPGLVFHPSYILHDV